MDQAKLRNLLITARDTITKSPSTPLPPVLPANLFSTPHGISSLANIHSLTPKIHRVHSIDLSSAFNTYTGPLHFLDSRASFDAIFGNDPAMLRLTNRSKGNMLPRIRIISIQKSTPFIISVGFIFFVIPPNLRMLVRRSMTRR